MFDLRIKEAIQKRSWKPTISFLTRFGVTNPTARGLLSNKTKVIKLQTLFDICFLLQCTPNDLLDIPDKELKQMPPNHPLRSLKKPAYTELPTEFLKTMNNEKLEQANAYLKKLWQESHAISEKEGSDV